MNLWILLAEAMRYPRPGHLERLEQGMAALQDRAPATLNRFLEHIQQLSLDEWEELYTRTFDLNPPGAPYVGFQIWGESYQRGKFLSLLNAELHHHQIATDGELPDHLIPVLCYLGTVPQPHPELLEVFGTAVERMQKALEQSERENPYVSLLKTIQHAWQQASAFKEVRP